MRKIISKRLYYLCKKRHTVLLIFFFVMVSALYSLIAATTTRSILFIGDSNTESCFLTGPLQKMLCDSFGYTGSGYFPLDSSFSWYFKTKGIPYVGFSPFTFNVTYSSFTLHTLFSGLTTPYLSPDIYWISGNVGATVSFPFVGRAVDVYWLSESGAGSFDIKIDNVSYGIVNTSGIRSIKKTTITNLSTANHTLLITVTSGNVSLLGADVVPEASGTNKRAVVHNWGQGGAKSIDFVNVDTAVFRSALQLVNPDIICILLGINDINTDKCTAASMRNNLDIVIQRIKSALPNSFMLLLSSHTNNTGTDANHMAIDYITQTAYAGAAKDMHVDYWNLNQWYAPFISTYALDPWHFNQEGGKLIAAELWKQIKRRMNGDLIPSSSNLIMNPGFEYGGRDGWSSAVSGSFDVVNGSGRTAYYAAHVSTILGKIGQQVGQLLPNTTYLFEGYVNNRIGDTVKVSVDGHNSGGSNHTETLMIGTGVYAKFSIEFATGITAASCSNVIVLLKPKSGSTTYVDCDFYVDDFLLTVKNPAAIMGRTRHDQSCAPRLFTTNDQYFSVLGKKAGLRRSSGIYVVKNGDELMSDYAVRVALHR